MKDITNFSKGICSSLQNIPYRRASFTQQNGKGANTQSVKMSPSILYKK
jgi:hypothetical protein